VASGKSIDEMAEYLPQNLDELVKLSGFGKAKAKLYGQQFLEVITGYCHDHDLTPSFIRKVQSVKERWALNKMKIPGQHRIDCIRTVSRLRKLHSFATSLFLQLNRTSNFLYEKELSR
jgi:hypothetical protein